MFEPREPEQSLEILDPSLTRRLLDDYIRRPPPGTRRPERLAELTDRELEILRLVAHGLSNREIADQLVIGETTVKTHVGAVLAKLPARDRVHAVVIAYESGLVTPGEGDADRDITT